MHKQGCARLAILAAMVDSDSSHLSGNMPYGDCPWTQAFEFGGLSLKSMSMSWRCVIVSIFACMPCVDASVHDHSFQLRPHALSVNERVRLRAGHAGASFSVPPVARQAHLHARLRERARDKAALGLSPSRNLHRCEHHIGAAEVENV